MRKPLRRLEGHLQGLIENSFDRLFAPKQMQNSLYAKIMEKLLVEAYFNSSGDLIAPHIFDIQMSPEDAQALSGNTDFLTQLGSSIQEAAMKADIQLAENITLKIVALDSLEKGDVQIAGKGMDGKLNETQRLALSSEEEHKEIPSGAFLIVNGTEIFTLSTSIVNVGRKRDNHLVIDNPRVSRRHGQLRAVSQSYHYFDVGSSAGSKLNGKSIQRSVLMPGDVLTLADVALIYGQDDSGEQGETIEIPSSDHQGDSEPTADHNKD